jgi:YebC/PmpR family DNA-binding regulatory protein
MAGHSHSANVARRKNAVDAKRAKIWSKIAKKMMVAAKRGADPAQNLALRYVIEEAKAANMPKDTIQKAIDKGSGAAGMDNFEAVTYEAYGPNGVAMIVEALTDNRSRTAPDLRLIFDRVGGNLATSGSVGFVFSKKGVILVKSAGTTEEQVMEVALDAGAEDVLVDEGLFEVVTSPTDFLKVRDAIEKAGLGIEDAQITNLPNNTVSLDPDATATFNKLLDALDDNDDVQNVYHNAELS